MLLSISIYSSYYLCNQEWIDNSDVSSCSGFYCKISLELTVSVSWNDFCKESFELLWCLLKSLLASNSFAFLSASCSCSFTKALYTPLSRSSLLFCSYSLLRSLHFLLNFIIFDFGGSRFSRTKDGHSKFSGCSSSQLENEELKGAQIMLFSDAFFKSDSSIFC